MKKSILAILITCAASMMTTSCNESFLDEEVLSSFAPETLNDPLGFDASIVGLHRHFSYFFTMSERQGFLSVWQAGTDIVWATQPEGVEIPYFRYAELSATDWAANFTWTWAYKTIKNANVIIANVESPDLTGMSQQEKDVINGEARFFRAYAYNMLVTLWGEVPLVLEPVTSPKTDFTRAPLSDVNAAIEADLLFAAEHLPSVDDVKLPSRANNAMARQLLAEHYLRVNRPADAETQCTTIINSNDFSLVDQRYGVRASEPGDPFSDMFIYGNQRRREGNTEGIWIFESENRTDMPGSIGGDDQHRRVWGCGYHNIRGMIPADTLGGRGLSRMRLNNWVLYDLYDNDDMRNSKYIIKRDFYGNNPAIPETYGVLLMSGNQIMYSDGDGNPDNDPVKPADTLFRMHPYTLKWGQFDPRDVFGYAMYKDLPLMRLGETYLLLAEARFKNNDPDGAADAINALRTRANAPLVDASDIDLNFILDERVRELVGEENRRMTLMRTGTLLERVATRNPATNNASINITGLTANNLLLPIPDSEINLNKDAELGQNPGYAE